MNKLMNISAIALVLGTVAAATVAHAALSAENARVTFQAAGPGGLKIEGTTKDLKAIEQEGSLVIDVPLSNLTTGIDLRDRHMKEKYLEVPKYPTATLTIARSALKMPEGGSELEADVPATLKLHGQTGSVVVHYKAKSDGTGVAVDGSFHIKMVDYGMSVPSYLGITVKPDVGVSASLHVAGN